MSSALAEQHERFVGSVPVLASLDFDETEAFYRMLGFERSLRSLVMMELRRGPVRLRFLLTGNRRIPTVTSCWIEVEGIEALHRTVRGLGLARASRRTDAWTAGGTLEVRDCHGNLLRFAERSADHPEASPGSGADPH